MNKSAGKNVLRIGHRGRPGIPRRGENTIRSFKQALVAGAEALELDVRKTKDGKLVVIHDLAIDRTTNGRGNVCDFYYEELMEFDAGHGGRIPLLAEVMDVFGGKCLLDIEIKESGTEEMIRSEIILRGLHELPYHRSVIVSAFDRDDNDPGCDSSWEQLRLLGPDIPIALIAQAAKIRRMGEAGFVRKAKECNAKAIKPEDAATTPELVDLAHSEGLLVYVWTVNEAEEIRRFNDMGADGLISDFAERLNI